MSGSGCEPPTWKWTRKGQPRCGRICTNGHGKRRFRWVKGGECGGEPPPPPPSPQQAEVSEFSVLSGAPLSEVVSAALGVPLVKLEPMPLIPLVGLPDTSLPPMKRRRRK